MSQVGVRRTDAGVGSNNPRIILLSGRRQVEERGADWVLEKSQRRRQDSVTKSREGSKKTKMGGVEPARMGGCGSLRPKAPRGQTLYLLLGQIHFLAPWGFTPNHPIKHEVWDLFVRVFNVRCPKVGKCSSPTHTHKHTPLFPDPGEARDG